MERPPQLPSPTAPVAEADIQLMHRLPRIGMLWHVVAAALLPTHQLWRWVAWGCGVLVLMGLEASRRWRSASTQSWILPVLVTFCFVQTELIVVTGGAHSPFLLIIVPVALLSTYVYGRLARWLVRFMALVIVALTLVEVIAYVPGVPPPPTLFSHRSSASLALQGWVLLLAIVLGSFLVRRLRAREQKRAERLLVAEQSAALLSQQRHESLQSLAGALAHELKNPMTTVTSITSFLQRKSEEGSPQREQLDVVVGELERVRARLHALLNLSRPLSPLACAPTDMARLVIEVMRRHEAFAEQHDVTLLPPQEAGEVACDARKISQVLDNLIQNAIEASPPSSSVQVEIVEGEDGVALEVRDRGEGLDPQMARREFSPGVTTKPAGSGLGLAISAAIVQQHSGRLTLDPRKGGGCVARLWLPLTATEAE